MRWWRALRQAYPNRSALTVAVVTLFFVVVIGGGFAWLPPRRSMTSTERSVQLPH
jgi:hypothetical protein